MSVDNIANILLFVIPGFISTEIYHRKYPAKKDSDFARFAWSVVASLFIFALAKGTDSRLGLGLIPSEGSANPKALTVVALLSAGLFLGLARLGIRSLRLELALRCPRMKWLSPSSFTTWPYVHVPPVEWAAVTLNDGTKYLGWIENWTHDPDEPEFDFLLKDARRVDEHLNTMYEIRGKGIYIRSSSLRSIEFYSGIERDGSDAK